MSLTHEELEEMLPAAALDMLEPAELEQVLAYVRDHPECDQLLREYREAAAALALELPHRQLDPLRARALRSRLTARVRTAQSVRGGAHGSAAAVVPTSRRATSIIYRWSGWMVAAGLTGVLLAHHSVHRPLDYGWLAAGVLVVVILGLGIYALVQRSRVTELEARLGDLGPKGTQDPHGGPRGGHSSVMSGG